MSAAAVSSAPPRRGHRQARVLALSMVLGEEGGPKLAGKAALTIALGTVALVVWAGFIEIDDVAMAHGQVAPGGEAETVRHADGGTVSEILVTDGDIVEKGQALIRFDGKEITEKVQRLEVQRAKRAMLAAQLRALGQGGKPDFSFALPRFKKIADNELLIFAGLKQLTGKRRRILNGRVTAAKTKLNNITEQERELSKDAGLLEEELELRQDLFNKSLTPKTVFLEAKKKVDRAHRDLADLAAARKSTAATLTKARKNSMALISRLRERALDELTIVAAELDAMDESLEDLKSRMKRLTITAPVKGVVKGSHAHPLGESVAPGAVVVQVTPFEGDAVIEIRIVPGDINRVRAGQPVSVRVMAAGFNRYGGISGRLREISPSTFVDDKGIAYYLGIIALDRDSVGQGEGKTRLLPGMDLEADIKTGARTLFATLLN